ncbi:type IIL restriction-modification enzyme MmeI, partial [Aeromonas caviae]
MAVNQTKISDDLKALVSAPDQSEFIFGFMAAYGLPKATITHIRQGGSRNLAKEAGHVGINSKFYFQPVDEGADIELLFEQRIAECASTKHKYRFVILTDFVRFLAWDVLTEERLDTELGELFREYGFFRKRPAKAVLTGATGYSAGRATRQGSSSPTRFTG